MFTSLPPRRLRCSAWAAGRSSPNCVPAPYSGNVTSRTRQNRSQSDAPGPKTDLRIDRTEDRQGVLQARVSHQIRGLVVTSDLKMHTPSPSQEVPEMCFGGKAY